MSLTGDLAETPLPDLIEFFCMRQESVALQISAQDGQGGVLFIEEGTVVDARMGELVGEGALRNALGLRRGDYRVERNVRCQQRTIFESYKKVILEAARLQDEAAHEASKAARAAPPGERRMATNVSAARQCTICGRESLDGTVCPIDGGALVARSASRPPDVRQYPTPQAVRMTPSVQTPPAQQRRASLPSIPPVPAAVAPPTQPPHSAGAASLKALGGAAVGILIVVAAALAVLGLRKSAAPTAAASSIAAVVQPQVAAPVAGVTDTEILFGMAAPFSGSAKELGRGMKVGFETAFAAANEAGGVHGRKLKLLALDDGYEPSRTKDVMRELVETRKVFGIVGNVGTPTSAVAVPYALEKKVLFFGAFTGAGLLRKDPPDRYVFNYRSSYAEETAAVVRYLVEQKRIKPEQIAVFAQEDGYGDAGFQGVANELRRKYKRDPAQILRVGYKRNTIDVQGAVERVVEAKDLKVVIMVPAYRAAARFVEKVKEKRPEMMFTSVSFVGSTALAEEFQQVNVKLGEGVIVTQVVPLPQSRSSVAMRYQDLLAKHAPGERADFVSFEGYLAANLLIEALKKQGRHLDTESLITTMEGLRGLDLGIGAPLAFGMSEHQASHKVWGTVLDSHGAYQPLELD